MKKLLLSVFLFSCSHANLLAQYKYDGDALYPSLRIFYRPIPSINWNGMMDVKHEKYGVVVNPLSWSISVVVDCNISYSTFTVPKNTEQLFFLENADHKCSFEWENGSDYEE